MARNILTENPIVSDSSPQTPGHAVPSRNPVTPVIDVSKIRLTDLSIKKLKADGQKLYIDSATPNFGVRVTAAGTKSFVVVLPDRRYKTIGRYPAVSLRDARNAAKAILAAPASKLLTTSISAARTAFLADCQARLRPASVDFYRHMLSGYTDWPKTESDPHRIRALKAFANWCLDHGHRTDNPYLRLKAPVQQRDRVLTDDEIAVILSYDHPPYSTIVKLLILTGQRRSQIASFDPAWIVDDTIVFPGSVMKSKRQHVIPLTDQVRALTGQLASSNSWSKHKERMDKHTGVTDWVLHDLRRYYSTTMAKLGTPLHITELLLDHRQSISGVAAVYNRYGFLPEMRQAVETYELHISKVVKQ